MKNSLSLLFVLMMIMPIQTVFSQTVLSYAEGGTSVDDPDSKGGAKYYIDFIAGNDANAGTSAAPWKNVSKVATHSTTAAAGTHYLFKRGSSWINGMPVYDNRTGIIDIRNVNGADGKRIVFGAYGSLTLPSPSLPPLQFRGGSYLMVRDLKIMQIVMRGTSALESDGTRYTILYNNEVCGQPYQGIVGLKKVNHLAIISNYIHDVAYGNGSSKEDALVLHSESWNEMTTDYDIGSHHWIMDNTIVMNKGGEDGIDIDSEHRNGELSAWDFKIIGNRIKMTATTGITETGIQVGHWGDKLWIVGNVIGGGAKYDALRAGGYTDSWTNGTITANENQNHYQISGNVIFYNDVDQNYESNIRVNHDNGTIYHNTLFSTQNPRAGSCVQYHTVRNNKLSYNLMSGANQLLNVKGSTVAAALAESNNNWYNTTVGSVKYMKDQSDSMTLAAWRAKYPTLDINSQSGAVPGVEFPNMTSSFNADPLNWNKSVFLDYFIPATDWVGNNGAHTPGAFSSDGTRLGMSIEPMNGNVDWEGPALVQQKLVDLGVKWPTNPVSYAGSKFLQVANNAIRVYPNPASQNGQLTIDLGANFDNATVEVLSLNGKLFYKKAVNGESKINLTTFLNNGLYTVRVSDGQNTYNQKLVVE